MFNKSFITSITLAVTIAITGTATAFAAKSNNPQNTPNASKPVQINPGQMHVWIQSALDGL